MKLVVYTAVAAGYDNLKPVRHALPGVDYFCFTESGRAVPPGWTHRELLRLDLSPQSQNRYAKFHPHLLFPGHDASVYVDGNIEVIGDVKALAHMALAESTIAFYDHPVRVSAFEEAIECALVGFDLSSVIRRQLRRYFHDGFAFQGGLFEGNVIVRAHHDIDVIRTMMHWWVEWQRGVKRDQLSLMYVLWKEEPRIRRLGRHDGRFIHDYFIYHPHRYKLARSLPRVGRQIINRLDLALFGMSVQGV